jgi:hypothetical protein
MSQASVSLSLPLFLLGLAASALAAPPPAWQGLWEGQVAGQRVVVALAPDESGRPTGRYFYERFGRDLTLWGASPDTPLPETGLSLIECPPDYSDADRPCDAPSATWTLSNPSSNAKGGSKAASPVSLSGQWQVSGQAGRRAPSAQPIALTRLGDYQANAEAFGDRYERLRMRGAHAETLKGGRLGPVQWQWLRDTRTKLNTPQFTLGAPPEVLARINADFQKQWRERVSSALTAVDYEDNIDLVFGNARWLATNFTVGYYYAGAAHPSSTFEASTYDLQTGQKVDFSRIFRISEPRNANLDLTRKDLLAAQVLKAMAAEVAAQPIAGKRPDGLEGDSESCFAMVLAHYGCKGGRCASEQLRGGHVPTSWHIWPTATGLAVSPDVYPEVARPCRGERVVLPWAQARSALIRPQALP